MYKDELDNDYVQMIAQKGNWYQNKDSLWFYMDEAVPFQSKDKPTEEWAHKLIQYHFCWRI